MFAVQDQPLLYLVHSIPLGFKRTWQDYEAGQVMAIQLHGLTQVPIYFFDEVVPIGRDDNPFTI